MQFIILVCSLAGLVWGAILFLRGGLLAGCLAVLLAGSCFGYYFFNLPVKPVPLTADRLLLAALVAQLLVYWRLGLTQRNPWGAPEWTLLGLVAVVAASTFMHDWRVGQNQPVANLVFLFLMPLAMYFVARHALITRRQVLGIFALLAAFAVYLSITAIAEVRGQWWLVFPKYIGSESVQAEYFGRARGPFLSPTGNGIFITACLCAALMWWPRLRSRGRIFLLALTVLCAAGVYYTLTRSVWFGAAGALLAVIGCGLPRVWRAPLLGGIGAAAALFLFANWEKIESFKRDKDISAHAMRESAELRPILAVVAWNMFCDRPLLGCGFGQYERESIYYLADRSWDLPLEKARPYVQHNTFLALLTETGIIGLFLFLLLLGYWTRDAWRLWRTPAAPLWARQVALLLLALIVAYIANAMFHDVVLIQMATMLLFLLAGMVSGLARIRNWAAESSFS